MEVWREGKSCAGFSSRLPDYAIYFWLKCFEKAITLSPKGKFLDIGAGDGRLSQLLLHQYSQEGVAIEVQVNQEKWDPILKQYPGFELKAGLCQDWLKKLQGTYVFDFVILIEFFEHLPPEEALPFLKQLNKVIANNGMLFLTTPNRIVQGPAEQSPIWHEKQPYGHHKHYTYQELKDLLARAGFSIQWHGFECHWIKTKFYNKLFYPISKLDARLSGSQKLPAWLRKTYSFVTIPVVLAIRAFFWTLAKAIYFVEKNYGNQNSSGTIMLLAQQKLEKKI